MITQKVTIANQLYHFPLNCNHISSVFCRIEDPDEAQDHFIVARSNCKAFAFVHIAYAQFEVSQGIIDY